MKLLFLDIDGVLNSDRTAIVQGKAKSIDNLDPIALGLVQEAINKTGAIICLSSDWRLSYNYMQLGKELKLPILFETSHKQEALRGFEIQAVVDGLSPEKYAILDDIGNAQANILASQRGRLVKVEGEDGVSYQNYLSLIEYLK